MCVWMRVRRPEIAFVDAAAGGLQGRTAGAVSRRGSFGCAFAAAHVDGALLLPPSCCFELADGQNCMVPLLTLCVWVVDVHCNSFAFHEA